MKTEVSLNEYFAAIVESSDDAIITKNLDSIIQTWNGGAERLFGYAAAEAIGQPVTMIIPEDRLHEEDDIIARLRRGERIKHFETVRRRKDGSLVPISATISPVRNRDGAVIGASKIARDITQQIAAAEEQKLLLAEMRHRVGNAFAVAGSLIAVTSREVDSPRALANLMRDRLMALSTAHRLAMTDPAGRTELPTSLSELVKAVVSPFAAERPVSYDILPVSIAPAALTALALILYELCTNAAKYGAFSQPDGRLTLRAGEMAGRLVIDWQEHCTIDPSAVRPDGFGTRMCQDVARSTLDGSITRDFSPTGLRATIDLRAAALRGHEAVEEA